MTKKHEEWLTLYEDAVAKRVNIDKKVKRREELYKGVAQPIDPKTGNTASKRADCKRNMCFELVETQINNSIPQPKVTPRDAANMDLAISLEGYLQMESDRLSSEEINDKAERGVLKQGTGFYLVGWDESVSTPTTSGEIFVKYYPMSRVYPQPGISDIKEAEYVFVEDLVSVEKIKRIYGVTIPEGGEYINKNVLITAYYINDNGHLSRFGWVKNTDVVVFDEEDYEIRKIKVCKECETPAHNHDKCEICGSTKFKYISINL